MVIDQYKWMKVIADPSSFHGGSTEDVLRPTTPVGRLLVNKSLMVYFYCVIAAQSSYSGWSESTRGLIEESFAKNVNSFTTNEPRFESKDLNDYYKFAKLNSKTEATFSLGKGYLLLPRDMKLKQTEVSKKIYKTKTDIEGVSTDIVKPKNHNQDTTTPMIDKPTKHVPIKKTTTKTNPSNGLQMILFATGAISFALWRGYI